MIIAIDGPSGAGKSTAAKLLAQKLDILYLDTGAMYRAAALCAIMQNIDFNDGQKIQDMLDAIKLDIKYDNGLQKIFLDGVDVSLKIREHQISKAASDISALKSVRLKMVALQREIAQKTDLILDGRDIGTFVLPNADFKFYLTASAKIRAQRRFDELTQKGQTCNYDDIYNDIQKRDYNDMNRDFAPLKKADDAIEINSDNLDCQQVVELILSYVRAK